MKIFLLTSLAVIVGYIIGFFGGMWVVPILSSNTHDGSVEAAMTGAFVIGPLVAVIAGVVAFIWLRRMF